MKQLYRYLFILALPLFVSCKKYLDELPDKRLAIPETVGDFRAILDGYTEMNNVYPSASEILADNYYLTSIDWSGVGDASLRNLYLWQADDNTGNQWNAVYTGPIKNANIVLDNIDNIKVSDQEKAIYNSVKGEAYFYRAFYHFSIAELFAKPYRSSSAGTDIGIPLRLNSDFTETSVRSSVFTTYSQIITDIRSAMKLLPLSQTIKTRPNLAAGYGFLAKVYLSMRLYDSAGYYAEKCLQLHDSLLNFNNNVDVASSSNAPLKIFNKEVIFHARGTQSLILSPARAKIDSNLFNSYAANDLRKTAFFRNNGNGTYRFKGDYGATSSSSGYVFAGIVTDEMYLIRAESLARGGNITEAMKNLNALLITRWLNGTYSPMTAASPSEALQKILTERRKELLFRGTRWSDLRRLADDPIHTITPQRYINNNKYELLPGSLRYVLQIPANVINLSGMPQNP